MPVSNTIRIQVKRLRETIAHHEHLYRESLLPEITDAQFDGLVRHLRDLESQYPELALPAVPASDGFTNLPTIPHRVPMLSIHATTKIDHISNWLVTSRSAVASFLDAAKREGEAAPYAIIMPKLDGMALSLFYRNGALVYALSRGRDGQEGHDVTSQALRLYGVQPRISELRDTIVRGEVVVKQQALRAFAMRHSNVRYSNARAAAVAVMRSNDVQLASELEACFVAYRRIVFTDRPLAVEASDLADQPFEATFDWLRQQYFLTVPTLMIPDDRVACSPTVLSHYVEQILDNATANDYAVDGAVVAIRVPHADLLLGQNEHHPHWMMAFKPPSQTGFSTLRSVDFSISRNGTVTPVGTIDAVVIADRTVTSVNLHSVQYLKDQQLRLGDRIRIGLIHDTVPQYLGVFVRATTPLVTIPTHCPSCQHPLSETPSGLACTNRYGCEEQAVDRFDHFASPRGLHIRGLGTATIRRLVREQKLQRFSDVFQLTAKDLEKAMGGSYRRAYAVWSEIQNAKVTSLPRLLVAFGIEDIGPSVAKPLARHFHHALLPMLDITDPKDFMAVPNISRGRAKALIDAFQHLHDDIRTLLDLGISWNVHSAR